MSKSKKEEVLWNDRENLHIVAKPMAVCHAGHENKTIIIFLNWNKCRLIQSCVSRQSPKSGISFVALRVWFVLWYASLAGGPCAGSCVFPNHIQSTELTTNGLQLNTSQRWLRERAKDLNTYANAIIKSWNLQVCKFYSLWQKWLVLAW